MTRSEIRARPADDFGNAATARVRLIVWCKECQHQVEPDPAEQAERYGAEITVPDWRVSDWSVRCAGREGEPWRMGIDPLKILTILAAQF